MKHGKEVLNHNTAKLEQTKPKATNFLTWEEFERLFYYEFKPEVSHLELTKDRFCFCCATSLRHSDMQILKKADFDDYDTMKPYIAMTDKTRKKMMDTNF